MGGTIYRVVAGVLALALVVVPGANALLEFQATYEIHEETETVTYSEIGGALPTIDCEGEWEIVHSSLSSTPSDRHLFKIRVDADGREVSISHRQDGADTWQIFQCTEGSSGPAVPTVGWRNEGATVGSGDQDRLLPGPLAESACDDDDPASGLERVAPFEERISESTSAPADVSPVCVEARGAAEIPHHGDVPFTGNVTATLTDGDGQEIWAQTCMFVFGSCWDDGEADAELPTPRPDGDTEWTLTCEAEPIFASYYHPVGSFSCRAWLG